MISPKGNKTEKPISIRQLIKAIERLPEDEPAERPGVWYRTQKEHWLGWLSQYHGPGYYGRISTQKRDARYAYNHIVCPEMLLYLARAIPLRPELVQAVEAAYQTGSTMQAKSGAIRKAAPWSEIYRAIWGAREPSLLERIMQRILP